MEIQQTLIFHRVLLFQLHSLFCDHIWFVEFWIKAWSLTIPNFPRIFSTNFSNTIIVEDIYYLCC